MNAIYIDKIIELYSIMLQKYDKYKKSNGIKKWLVIDLEDEIESLINDKSDIEIISSLTKMPYQHNIDGLKRGKNKETQSMIDEFFNDIKKIIIELEQYK